MEAKGEGNGKYVVVYDDYYARAEPLRMALWKAGVDWEDRRLSGDSFKEFKASP